MAWSDAARAAALAARRARAKRYTKKTGLNFREASIGSVIGTRASVAKALKAVRAHARSQGKHFSRKTVRSKAQDYLIHGKRSLTSGKYRTPRWTKGVSWSEVLRRHEAKYGKK